MAGIKREINCDIFRNPTSNANEYVNVEWEPKGTEDNYMNINQELKMEKGLLSDRADFWKDLYKNVLA